MPRPIPSSMQSSFRLCSAKMALDTGTMVVSKGSAHIFLGCEERGPACDLVKSSIDAERRATDAKVQSCLKE